MKSGHEPSTTNNRMEIQAVLEALRYCRGADEAIEIYTDSEYVRCACSSWLAKWKSQGWDRQEGPLKNVDLWIEVDEAMSGLDVAFLRVPGHSGNAMNDLCDQLAGDAARGRCVDEAPRRSWIAKPKVSPNVFFYMEDPEPMSHFTEDVLVLA